MATSILRIAHNFGIARELEEDGSALIVVGRYQIKSIEINKEAAIQSIKQLTEVFNLTPEDMK